MTEAEIRAAHPDWTDEQVAAEVARLKAETPPPPEPKPDDRDRAFAEQRRKADEAERRAKAAEDALAERERKEAEEQGRWKEIAEKAEAKAADLEARHTAAEQRRNAERAASDLKVKDTGYALYLLEQDKVDLSDPSAVKTALEQLTTNRPDLLGGTAPPPPTGGPAGGTGPTDPPKLTADQLRAMTPQQVAALDPKVVNDAVAGL